MARPSSAAKTRVRAEVLLEELKQVAERVGLEVREERLLREAGYHVRSGACRVRDQNLVLIDRELPVSARVEVLLDVLARRDLRGVYVPPAVRRALGLEELG